MIINGMPMARMLSPRSAALLAVLLVSPAAFAADQAAVPSAASTSQTTTSIDAIKPSPEALLLAEIRKQTALTEARADGLESETRLRELKSALGQTAGDDRLPQLIGLYGVGQNVTAEFLSGKSLLTVHPGDYVNNTWRLSSVVGNGVVLASKGGKTLRLLLGQGGQSQPTNTSYSPRRSSAQSQVAPTQYRMADGSQ